MSTIDKASLIQIPSGYKNGKLYSVKPNPTYGSEEITNGDFSSNSDWTLTSSANITNGKLNVSAGAFDFFAIQTALVNGNFYKISIELEVTSGSLLLYTGSQFATIASSGVYNYNFTSDSTQIRFRSSGSGFVGSIDNVSVKEVLNDGDFTFARSSSGTRVNSEGLIEVASVLGTTELVTNGDFASSSNWNFVGDGSISNGELILPCCIFNNRVSQSIGMSSSKLYKLEINITQITSGDTIDYLQGGAWHIFGTQLGINTVTISNPTDANLYLRNNNGAATIKIDNVSVKEVIQNDVPRLDYSGGASCASLLLESQRTNTMIHSELFTDSVYQRTSMSLESSPSGVSPDGTTNAFKVNPSVNGSSSFMFQSSTLTGSDMTQSIFVKSNSSTGRFVQLTGSSGVSNQAHVNFDLLNGTIYDSTGVFNAFIEDYGNDWYRIGITSNTSATAGRFIFAIVSSLSSGRLSGTGVTTDMEFYVYGYQLENGAFKTSYIPTTSSTVTRTADVCNNAGTSATFNDSEGVLFAEIAALSDDLTYRQISLTESSGGGDVLTLDYSSTSNQIRSYIRVNGATQSLTHTLTDETQYNKIAIKYKDTHEIWVNGSKVASSLLILLPIDINLLTFDNGSGNGDFYGKTKQLIYFDEALSDEELSDLTGQVNLSFNNLATFYGYTIL